MNEVSAFRDAQLERTLQQLRGSLEDRGASLAQSMAWSANEALAGYDFTFLNIMVQQAATNDSEIRYCIIMDKNRKALAHSVAEKVGSTLGGVMDLAAAGLLQDFVSIKVGEAQSKTANVRFIDGEIAGAAGSEPIMEVLTPIYSGNRLWGVLRCGYSLQALKMETDRVEDEWTQKMGDFNFHFLSMSAVFFLLGAVVAAFFTRSFAKSMYSLSDGVARVGAGDLHQEISQSGIVCAEVMELSSAFNSMTGKLRESYQELEEHRRSLADKVEEKTKELEEAQANLIQQAHEAGMAEMAVGILHNIGNAITPAKIGTTLLIKQLSQSAVRRHLPTAMEQIRETLTECGSIADSEKERLLGVIGLLPESLEEECNRFSKELGRVAKKHDHIEAIIGLQMRYANLIGHAEEVDISRLADDALRILQEALTKRSIIVVKDLGEVPLVEIEESKLIQIFINLIKNAYEAMESLPADKRQLAVSTGLVEGAPGMVFLSVRDQGIGFTEDDKGKLFRFGYSSKQRGSGFGLHSCANYLIANRGSITAHSDGPGKGAEFTVILPSKVIDGSDKVGDGGSPEDMATDEDQS